MSVLRTIGSRSRDVVLEGRTIDLGKPWGWKIGMGREWRGGGQFTSNLGPGWTRITPHRKEGFQVSKRVSGAKGNWQGELARGIGKGN
jgi:hypothetical protein